VYARHHRLAEGTRAAVKAWGLQLCAKDPKWNSDTVSAVMTPAGVDASQIIATAFKKYDLALGAGLAQMSGKLFRIGHLGDLNELMLLGAIAGAEMSMRDVGMTQIVPGSGVGAASEYWRTGGATTSAPAPKSAEKRQAPAVAAR
jgi:alanine-glyoxylate transaminase / serine-glyoxylate transaminase / serine-pyruvate transaminase